MKLLFLTALVVFSVDYVTSFSSGVPPLRSVCLGMTPQHEKYTPQTSAAPYSITISNTTVNGGNNIEVILRSTGDAKFKGFYIQGRDDKGNPVGSFEINKVAKAHSCGGIKRNAAHHANGKEEKTEARIVWEAPSNYNGGIQFIGTFVKDFVHIWAGVTAEPLTVKA